MKFLHEHKEWAPLVLRVAFGFAFVVAGVAKILNLAMVKGMFAGLFGASLGTPLAYLTIVVELAGGIMLLLNWHAACAALALTVVMVVAGIVTWSVDWTQGIFSGLQQIMIMNGKSNLPVNFAYIAGLLSLAFSGCEQCAKRKR